MTEPTEIAICLAAVAAANHPFAGSARRDGWVPADAIRNRLEVLGYTASTQQIAAWLGRMARCNEPWIEHRQAWGYREYRLTLFGKTDVHNRFPGVMIECPWLPVYRGPVRPDTAVFTDDEGSSRSA